MNLRRSRAFHGAGITDREISSLHRTRSCESLKATGTRPHDYLQAITACPPARPSGWAAHRPHSTLATPREGCLV